MKWLNGSESENTWEPREFQVIQMRLITLRTIGKLHHDTSMTRLAHCKCCEEIVTSCQHHAKSLALLNPLADRDKDINKDDYLSSKGILVTVVSLPGRKEVCYSPFAISSWPGLNETYMTKRLVCIAKSQLMWMANLATSFKLST